MNKLIVDSSLFIVCVRTVSIVLFSIVALALSVGGVHAADISLSPGSGSFAQGSNFNVVVNVNTGGEAVNAVEVKINYPADKLKANFISHSGSAFDITAESFIGNGQISIAKGKLPPAVSGFRRVATIGFSALTEGSATVSVSGDSKVLREADSGNVLSGSQGATFTIGAPVSSAPPPAGQEPSEQTTPEIKNPPQISDVEVLNLGYQTATIVWKTDKSSDSQIEYGFVTNRETDEVKYFFSAQSGDLTQDHELELSPTTLIPGHLYHFRVLSKDEDGLQSASLDSTFVVPGYGLSLTVLGSDSKPVAGAKVTIPEIGVSVFSDKEGIATFSDLPTGVFSVEVDYRGKIKVEETELVADKNSGVIVLDAKASALDGPLVIVLAVLVGIFVLWFVWRMWRGRKHSGSFPPPSGLPIVESAPDSGSSVNSQSFPQVSQK